MRPLLFKRWFWSNFRLFMYFIFFVQKGMLVFDVAQFDGILKKVMEFNSSLLSEQVV